MLSKSKLKLILLTILMVASFFNLVYFYMEKNEKVENLSNQVRQSEEQLEATKQQLEETKIRLDETEAQMQSAREDFRRLHTEVSRSRERSFPVTITAYNLDVESCGKTSDHPAYGYTASGKDLSGHSLHSARAIAVDPSVMPMGSKVRIRFKNSAWKHLNGIYTAVDTGGAINGNRIDLFFGENSSRDEMMAFGVQEAVAEIL